MSTPKFSIMSCFFSIAALFLIALIIGQNIESNITMDLSSQKIIMESPAPPEPETPIDMHNFTVE
ncbi:hypothetical protein Dhaf_0695 [Desulfitobacterium hafniense DCB-2]|uniref:Uncharacterized protein n=1 Tax=Desulfitobacterium hafniense (strain DSM 10664 / DCB-2) TaxID=272564 RepID=B8FVX3_DESHD|nr:hypothetical protein [Desulfitobacterium hafniense]ACL18759.1 hypothetical protein Dhaf_0695 [Desulfitobacterium hafniense DCB-2]